MNQKISAVIICKNEEHIIGKTISAVLPIADEVVVYDTGSTDRTIEIAEGLGARVIRGAWEGYGITKQRAVHAARNNWVLNIDSDEVLNNELQEYLKELDLSSENIAYKARFINYLGPNKLHWGEFGFASPVRLFNKTRVNWNESAVHEKLMIPPDVSVRLLKGRILHYTMKDTSEFVNKSVNYALLNAVEYHKRGKKATWIKQFIAPVAMFLKYYIFRLGFLDGWAGLFAARMASLYTYLKYTRLRELNERGEERG